MTRLVILYSERYEWHFLPANLILDILADEELGRGCLYLNLNATQFTIKSIHLQVNSVTDITVLRMVHCLVTPCFSRQKEKATLRARYQWTCFVSVCPVLAKPLNMDQQGIGTPGHQNNKECTFAHSEFFYFLASRKVIWSRFMYKAGYRERIQLPYYVRSIQRFSIFLFTVFWSVLCYNCFTIW